MTKSRSRLSAARFILAAASIAVFAAARPASAQEVELDADGASLVGGSLNVTVTLQDSGGDPVDVEVFLDGEPVSRHSLEIGTHGLRVSAGRLSAGRHRVEVRAAGSSAETEVTVLPGWLSIIPPVVAITLALVFKNVLLSLFLGVWIGAMFLNDWQPFAAVARIVDYYVVNALTDPSRAQILLFSILLGGMVGIISKSGGTQGIVERLSRHATTPRRGQVSSWLMGIVIFFDDYANTLIVGSTMRPITDRLRISREKLAYIVDSTAAPVVSIFPISTWVGFEIGLLSGAFAALELPFNAYGIFLQSIPYRFYQILALALGLTIALSRRDFGPMLKAERRARATGAVLAEDATPLANYGNEALAPPEGAPRRAVNSLAPIATVIVVTILGLFVSGSGSVDRAEFSGTWIWLREVFAAADPYAALIWSSLSGVLVALVLPIAQRILTIRQGMDALVEGFKSMILAFCVLLLAWSLGDVCTELHTSDYLVELASGALSPHWLPVIVFLLAAAIAFATGTSWGVLAILTPLSIPLAHGLSLEAGYELGSETYMVVLVATVAAVLAGSVWGDHCSPISDTTILSSMATGSDHIAHVRTQLPYALAAGIVGIVAGQVPAAYGLHPVLALLIGIGIIFAIVRWVGRPVDEGSESPSPTDESPAPG
jgi:Na+/H+ antiporter NhaC